MFLLPNIHRIGMLFEKFFESLRECFIVNTKLDPRENICKPISMGECWNPKPFLLLDILQDIFIFFIIRGIKTFSLIPPFTIDWWAWMSNWHLIGRNYHFLSAFSSESQLNHFWIQYWVTLKVICLAKVGCFQTLHSAWVHLSNLQILKFTPTENDYGTLIRMSALSSEIGSFFLSCMVFLFLFFSKHWSQVWLASSDYPISYPSLINKILKRCSKSEFKRTVKIFK